MPDCGDEPDLLPAALLRCGEVPFCAVVHCFRRVVCLVANTTALVIPGCRTPSDDGAYHCVCPQKNDPIRFRSYFAMASQSGGPAGGNVSLPTVMAHALNAAGAAAGVGEGTNVTSTAAGTAQGSDDGHLGGGAIAGIVIGAIAAFALLVAVGVFIFRKVRDQRKNHGEYRPQLEETMHAKELPYLPPPQIESHLG